MRKSTNNTEDTESQLSVILEEYGSLKREQSDRIRYRDNLLYTAIGAVGGICSVALGGFGGRAGEVPEAFLLVPWVTTILGWTYIQNDQKVTAIRQYIENVLAPQIKELIGTERMPLGWEVYHRADPHRSQRKAIQLAIDLGTFVFSAVGALLACAASYVAASKPIPAPVLVLIGVELVIVVILAVQFVAYSNIASRPK